MNQKSPEWGSAGRPGRTSSESSTSAMSPGAIAEGASDFFFSRPYDVNPYSRTAATQEWASWRFGWEMASWLEELRGVDERGRWAA